MLEACVFVIFGSTGHLSRTKLLPALYRLHQAGRLPENLVVLGMGRRPWDDIQWRAEVGAWLKSRLGESLDDEVLAAFLERLHFFSGDINAPESAIRLRDKLENTPVFLPTGCITSPCPRPSTNRQRPILPPAV